MDSLEELLAYYRAKRADSQKLERPSWPATLGPARPVGDYQRKPRQRGAWRLEQEKTMGFDHVKPIETRYRDVRFRSRLEARWAVYFDAEGIEWEYEPEAFEIDTGVVYLPDFWLPQVRMFAEVKRSWPTIEELIKCRRLADLTNRGVLILDGPPDDTHYLAIDYYGDEQGMWNDYVVCGYKYVKKEGRFYSSVGNQDYPEPDKWLSIKRERAPTEFPVDDSIAAARLYRFWEASRGTRS